MRPSLCLQKRDRCSYFGCGSTLQCIDKARDILDTELTAMVGESYSRAYGVSTGLIELMGRVPTLEGIHGEASLIAYPDTSPMPSWEFGDFV